MWFNQDDFKVCDICGGESFLPRSYAPHLNVCSKSCLRHLLYVTRNLKIKKKHLKRMIEAPFASNKKLEHKYCKKNKISIKILRFHLNTEKNTDKDE